MRCRRRCPPTRRCSSSRFSARSIRKPSGTATRTDRRITPLRACASTSMPHGFDLGDRTSDRRRDRRAAPGAARPEARPILKELARTVDELVMQPLRAVVRRGDAAAHLAGRRAESRAVRSARRRERPLPVERYAMSYLTSGRDLLRNAGDAAERRHPRSSSRIRCSASPGCRASTRRPVTDASVDAGASQRHDGRRAVGDVLRTARGDGGGGARDQGALSRGDAPHGTAARQRRRCSGSTRRACCTSPRTVSSCRTRSPARRIRCCAPASRSRART